MPVSERKPAKNDHRRKGISLLFFLGTTLSLFSQEYNFRVFNTEDGLAQSYIYSVIQDNRGYLWVGTGDGLSRYNGFKFESYSTSDTLSDNFITSSLYDTKSVWFGHMNGTLTCFDSKKYFSVSLPGSDGSPITHLAKNQQNEIWVSSYSGILWKLNGQSGAAEKYSMADPLSIVSFDFLDREEMLIGTTEGLVQGNVKKPGILEIHHLFTEIPESRITCIQKMRNGTGFYIATEDDDLFLFRHTGGRFSISEMSTGAESYLTGIQYIYEDSRFNIWLATFGNGLVKLIPDSTGRIAGIVQLDKDHGFPSDNVKILFEDREGNIWSGSYGEGLILLTYKSFSFLKPDLPFPEDAIFSIFIDKQYRWLGTENGLIKMDQLTGKIIRVYGRDSGLPKDTITAIYSPDEKEFWIGTDKHGVFRMNAGTGKIARYPLGYGELENSITAICGKGEQVWIGTKKGLCHVNLLSSLATWYTINQGGLPHNFVNCLYLDKSERLWVSTHSNILSYFQDGKINKIPVSAVVGSMTLGPITEDADSRIWVGSNGNGVFRISFDSIASITTQEGLLSNYCYSIINDDQKNIWVGHKDGLSRIRTTDFSVKPFRQIEGSKESYQFNPNAICKDPKRKIWFGTNNGLVAYDPFMEDPGYVPPALSLVSVKVNDVPRNFEELIILPPGIYNISIEYIGINLKEPELVTYQYKMLGYDQHAEITKDNSVTYNHLTEGQYRFIIVASSGDGRITETPVVLNIIIKRPIWKKWWFYLLILISLTGLVFGYIKRREYKFLLEKAELEEKVRQRTHEIQKQKDEIELQRDMIRIKNEHITSSIMYAGQIQNAVLPPIDLIDRLFPHNFILNKPKDIVSGDFYWFVEKDDKIFIALADCTGHGVPGAFMSLLGITFLNEIVNVEGITKSDDIVTNLRQKVSQALQQDRKDSGTNDGIDIALCVFDPMHRTLQFTGGMNDMVYIRDGELTVLKADHISVSALQEDSGKFTMKEINVLTGDTFYLFSDGYPDQFGGEHNKKYHKHRLLDKFLVIHTLPMIRQREILETDLSEWMKDNIQTDDITVIGIRL